MEEIVVDGSDVIIGAILVLAVGTAITRKVKVLNKFSIPIACWFAKAIVSGSRRTKGESILIIQS